MYGYACARVGKMGKGSWVQVWNARCIGEEVFFSSVTRREITGVEGTCAP